MVATHGPVPSPRGEGQVEGKLSIVVQKTVVSEANPIENVLFVQQLSPHPNPLGDEDVER